MVRFVTLAHEAMSKPVELATGEKVQRADIEALRLILSVPGITVSEAAAQLHRTCGTMSLRAAKLEKDGLVRRGKEEGSDRLCHLHLTDAGSETIGSCLQFENDRARQIADRLLSSFTLGEVDTLIRMLGFLSSDMAKKQDPR